MRKPSWVAGVIWSLLFGITLGISIATVGALVAALWSWISNPAELFRDENGTHWPFVFETAFSWFLPLLLTGSLLAFLGRLGVFGLSRWQRSRR